MATHSNNLSSFTLRTAFLALILSSGLFGCATVYDKTSTDITITDSHPLPVTLAESSGLYCLDNRALTINDSGNAATVFTIDASATILSQATLTKPNVDWEAITANGDAIFVGDIGNNRGDRTSLSIEVISRDSMEYSRSIAISYEGYRAGENVPYAHDFDAEAMTWHDGKLLLFSKSWASRVSHIYEIDTQASQQTLKAVAHLEGLPGVITGADWDEQRGQYVIVGYASDPFGNFDTFLAEVSAEFAVTAIWPLPEHNQVEGVCVAADGSYWVSQESVGETKASLFRVVSPTLRN